MAIFTKPGRDIIRITDTDYLNDNININHKIHIIRLDFGSPDDIKMEWVITKFNNTNRYVIDVSNLKYYNYFLKRTNLKYYIINTSVLWKGVISFYKRNNKVLLDTTCLSKEEHDFVMNVSLKDVLFNTEVIIINKTDYDIHKDVIDKWKGNCIINDINYII